MLLSVMPFAVAEGESENQIIENPETTPVPTSTEESIENEIADVGAIVQENEDGTLMSTVDVFTPEKTCEHEHEEDAKPTKIVYEQIDNTYHKVTKEYVCSLCGQKYLDKENAVTEIHVIENEETEEIIVCQCGFSIESLASEIMTLEDPSTTPTPAPTATVFEITDAKDGDKNVGKATLSEGTLTITKGTQGAYLPDYTQEVTEGGQTVLKPVDRPWKAVADQIKQVIVESTITRIGDWALAQLTNLKDVFVNSSTLAVGDYAFAGDTALEDVNYTSKTAAVTYDNATAEVTYDGKTEKGSTAFYGDGTVSINYNCQNTKAAEQKKTEFVNVNEVYGCYHNNPVIIYGYAPKEFESGLTDGLYCKDCSTWIQYQYKIYPNGKPETGKFKFENILKKEDLKDIPEILKGASLEKTFPTNNELLKFFKEELSKLYKEEFKKDLTDKNFVVYDVIQTEGNPPKDAVNIFNIPYPQGTWPASYDFIVLQLKEDGTTEELDTYLTNKGIQVESETLMPVGVAWIAK